ncbi:MAG: exonuclease subunit SbcD [Anaerolineae bacterium]
MPPSIRLIHFADFHLGVENYGRLDPETGVSGRVKDFLKCLDFLVETALAEEVDLVLFAGDAYRTRDPSPTYQREFARRIRRLAEAGIQVFLLVGNHDMPGATGRAHSVDIFQTLAVPNVTVADRPSLHRLETRRGPVQVVAIPWLTYNRILLRDEFRGLNVEEIRAEVVRRVERFLSGEDGVIRQLDGQVPAVLAFHGSVQGAVYGSEQSVLLGQDIVLPPSLVRLPGLDYVALGHIHKHQVLWEDPPVVYAGSLERVDFGEEKEEKGFILAEVCPGKAEYRFVPTPTRPMRTLILHPQEPNPTGEVLSVLQGQPLEEAIVRVVIHLRPEQEPLLDERAVRQALEGAYYVAAINKEVERPTRLRLGPREAIEGLTPLQILEQYFLQKGVPRARIQELLKRAEGIMQGEDV